MNKINMAISHSLTQDEAVNRLKRLLHDVKTQFSDQISGFTEEWDCNTGKVNFSAMGFPLSGMLTVKASQVEISGELPLVAIPFKGQLESMIKNRTETLLV